MHFRSHLQDSQCWSYLDDFEKAYAEYCKAESNLETHVQRLLEESTDESALASRPLVACRLLQKRELWATWYGQSSAKSNPERIFLVDLFDGSRFDDGFLDGRFYSYLEPPKFMAELAQIRLDRGQRGYDVDLHRLVDSVAHDQSAAEALVTWRKIVERMWTLARRWATAIGPETALRHAITNGQCHLCPA